MAGLAPLLLALLLAPQAPPDDEAARLWAAGERVAAVERLAARLVEAPDDLGLRRRLVTHEVEIHRYAAALQHAEGLGSEVDDERGYCLFRLGRFEEALGYLDPKNERHALLIFDTLESLGRGADAAAALERAAEVLGEGDPRVLVRRGRMCADAGEHGLAEQAFRRALEGDGVLLDAWFGLGQALVRQGKRDEARAALERHRALVPLIDAYDFARKSLDLAPNHAPNHAALGDVERQLGRLGRAETSYAAAARLAQPAELPPIALRHARLLDEDRRDPDGAARVLDEAFARVPDPRLAVRAGDVLLAAGRPEEALSRFEQARRLRPSDAEVQRRIDAARRAGEGR
ncbi:MAG: tetratricopeptide repeat protein [Planctomycetota bacterium]